MRTHLKTLQIREIGRMNALDKGFWSDLSRSCFWGGLGISPCQSWKLLKEYGATEFSFLSGTGTCSSHSKKEQIVLLLLFQSISICQEHKGKTFYDGLVQHMTSGETLFMVLEREDAVDGWRHLIGPTDPSTAKEEEPDR